jgi:putative transposase
MDSHLGYEKHSAEGINSGNSRNGKTSKTVKTTLGEIDLEIPRDRNSSFELVLIPKRSRKVEAIEDIIISLYAKGMTVRDIEAQIREVYGCNISDATISNVTSKVTNADNRMTESPTFIGVLCGVDGRDCFQGQTKTVKLSTRRSIWRWGLNSEGHKEMLGMWLGENESASFWMSVLTDMRSRGVKIFSLPAPTI